MKILIADDEELVREGLKNILRSIAQADSISEAVNGRSLIRKAREISPDICFVDIRMPGITGLEAIETLTCDFPDTSWIILSGYSDFEYARRALSLGVCDYLLKPATEAEVETALAKATEKRLDAGRLKREKFEYRVSGVLNNSSAVEFDDFLQQQGHYAAVVFMPSENGGSLSAEMQRELAHKMRSSIDKNPPHGFAGAFNVVEGYPAIIAAGSSPLESLAELQALMAGALSEVGTTEVTPECSNLPELLGCIEEIVNSSADPGNPAEDENPESSSRIVRQAEKLIREQYSEPIGVAQIAEQLNVTPNYLSSLFKKYKQVSFTSYITEMRLRHAPLLLETPGITVKEAASRLGYMSSRHFAKLFREKYGKPPSEYRK